LAFTLHRLKKSFVEYKIEKNAAKSHKQNWQLFDKNLQTICQFLKLKIPLLLFLTIFLFQIKYDIVGHQGQPVL